MPITRLTIRALNVLKQWGLDNTTPEEVRAKIPSYSMLMRKPGCGKAVAFEICDWAGIETPPKCPHCGQFMP